MPARTIDLKVTVDEEDNETLEMVSLVLAKTPDELLGDILETLPGFIKDTLVDLRKWLEKIPPEERVVLRSVIDLAFSRKEVSQ